MQTPLALDELRSLFHVQTQREVLPLSLFPQGIPKGAITQIVGAGKSELAAQLLAENKTCKAAWVEEKLSIFPLALQQRSVDLNRILFVEAGVDIDWAALQSLRSQVFQILTIYNEHFEEKFLRRLQLAAEKSQTAVLWLSSGQQRPWTIRLQLRAEKAGGHLQITENLSR